MFSQKICWLFSDYLNILCALNSPPSLMYIFNSQLTQVKTHELSLPLRALRWSETTKNSRIKNVNVWEMEKWLTLQEWVKALQAAGRRRRFFPLNPKKRGRRLLRMCASSFEVSHSYLVKPHVNYKYFALWEPFKWIVFADWAAWRVVCPVVVTFPVFNCKSQEHLVALQGWHLCFRTNRSQRTERTAKTKSNVWEFMAHVYQI